MTNTPLAVADSAWATLPLPELRGYRKVQQRADGAAWQHPRSHLQVIATIAIEQDGERWLHCSAMHRDPNRIPTWDELKQVKDDFIGAHRTALQVLPSAATYVNINPNVLHLWCCLDGDVTPDFTAGSGSL